MITIPGVPLRGQVKDRLGTHLNPGEASALLNVWREAEEVRARPGLSTFANTPATLPVQNLFSADQSGGTKALLRFDATKVYNYDGVNWVEIMPGATVFTGGATSPFGVTMSYATATAVEEMIFSQGTAADLAWRWTGSGDIAQIAAGGVLKAFRYATYFANRVIGAYTSTAGNGAIEVIGSVPGSTTSWAAASGAFSVFLAEHPSIITGLVATDTDLLVHKERAIIRGVQTGDLTTPFIWGQLKTEGIGTIAPRSIALYGGTAFALSYEGFYFLNGNVPQAIDADIKRDFALRFNYTNAAQVHSLVMPEFGKIAWFIPEASDVYPKNVWVFDVLTGGWDRWSLPFGVSAATRAFVSTGGVIDSYDTLIDTGTIADTIIDQVGVPAATPSYVLGAADGKTYLIDFNITDDAGASFALSWQTGDVRWEGQRDLATGHIIGPHDLVTFDHALLEYRYAAISGSTANVTASISVDGGATWTVLQTRTLVATTSNYARLHFWGRVSGDQVRLKFDISQVLGLPRFRNLTIFGKWAGERR